jgi:hypothetical protein
MSNTVQEHEIFEKDYSNKSTYFDKNLNLEMIDITKNPGRLFKIEDYYFLPGCIMYFCDNNLLGFNRKILLEDYSSEMLTLDERIFIKVRILGTEQEEIFESNLKHFIEQFDLFNRDSTLNSQKKLKNDLR